MDICSNCGIVLFNTSSDATEELVERSLYTGDSIAPDVLVRTSGEVRLSDFLLWQSSFSQLAFIDALWPDFSIWQLAKVILNYQQHESAIREERKRYEEQRNTRQVELDAKLLGVTKEHGDKLLQQFAEERCQRITQFLHTRRAQFDKFIEQIALSD